MAEHALVEFKITANTVTARFFDPERREAEVDVSGPFSAAPLPSLGGDGITHGRALRNALLTGPKVRDVFDQALQATIRRADSRPLRIRIALPPGDIALNELGWEALLDLNDDPLTTEPGVYFSRLLIPGKTIGPDPKRPRALVVIANPAVLSAPQPPQPGGFKLLPVNVAEEEQQALTGLSPMPADVIKSKPGQPGLASKDAILAHLRNSPEPCHVLYLVCHGALFEGQRLLWLDEPNGEPVNADLLVDGLAVLPIERRPQVVVLASCQSAGQTKPGQAPTLDRALITSLGPALVEKAGIAAVVAMRGNIFQGANAAMMPEFFSTLVATGQVEAAMAAGRGPLVSQSEELIRDQWWVPVLFSGLRSGNVWPAERIEGRVVYLAHAILPGAGEAPALVAVREELKRRGFRVEETEPPPEELPPTTPAEQLKIEVRRSAWWTQRLLDGLGTCDAAVVLITQGALDNPNTWLKKEAALLHWRDWREDGFQLIPICVGNQDFAQPASDPWSLLWQIPAADLSWTGEDDLEANVRSVLDPLGQVKPAASGWLLTKWERLIRGPFENLRASADLEGATAKIAGDFDDLGVKGELAARCARLVLCNGPAALWRLYETLSQDNANLKALKREVSEVFGPVQPAWVDASSAAEIAFLAARADRAPGAFYLQGLDLGGHLAPGLLSAAGVAESEVVPVPQWIATCYAARICGLGYDNFTDTPLLLMASILRLSSNDEERASTIRDTLAEALQTKKPGDWIQALQEAMLLQAQAAGVQAGGPSTGGPSAAFDMFIAPAVDEPFDQDNSDQVSGAAGGGPEPPATDPNRLVDTAIRLCVERMAQRKQPVLLLLSGRIATQRELLAKVREQVGPVVFFFMGQHQVPPPDDASPWLTEKLASASVNAYLRGYAVLTKALKQVQQPGQ